MNYQCGFSVIASVIKVGPYRGINEEIPNINFKWVIRLFFIFNLSLQHVHTHATNTNNLEPISFYKKKIWTNAWNFALEKRVSIKRPFSINHIHLHKKYKWHLKRTMEKSRPTQLQSPESNIVQIIQAGKTHSKSWKLQPRLQQWS